MTSGSIVAIVTDSHVGGSTALAPPKFTIHTGRKDETQIVTANAAQLWLYKTHTDFFDYAKSLAGIRGKYRKKRLIVIHLGDVHDGVHHKTVQVMIEVEDQVEAACNIYRPVVATADDFYLTYGTSPHSGEAASHEISFARELGIKHDWYFALNIDELLFDVGHHGRAGQREWSSSAAGMATEVALEYVKAGLKPPAYVLRGHQHKVDDSGIKVATTRSITIPSWQFKTAYGNQAAPNSRCQDFGGLIIDTSDPFNPNMSRMRINYPHAINVVTV